MVDESRLRGFVLLFFLVEDEDVGIKLKDILI